MTTDIIRSEQRIPGCQWHPTLAFVCDRQLTDEPKMYTISNKGELYSEEFDGEYYREYLTSFTGMITFRTQAGLYQEYQASFVNGHLKQLTILR